MTASESVDEAPSFEGCGRDSPLVPSDPQAAVSKIFHSPSSGSAEAATAPFRLTREFKGHVRWRELPDGQIEVATLDRDGRLERRLVQQDGTTTPVSFEPASDVRALGKALVVAGIALGAAALFQLVGDDHPDAGPTWAGRVAIVLLIAGAIVRGCGGSIDWRLRKVGGKKEWNEPTDLGEWAPHTSAQLGAVEQIADEADGEAFVRDAGSWTVEVYTRQRGVIARYSVDETGRIELLEKLSTKGEHVGALFSFAGFVGFIVVLFTRQDFLAATLVFFAGIVAAFLADRLTPVDRRVRELKDGPKWHAIRTVIEDND